MSSEKPVSKSLKSGIRETGQHWDVPFVGCSFRLILETIEIKLGFFFHAHAPPKLSSSLPCVSIKSSALDTSLIKSSSESILPVVVAGVAIRLFFTVTLAELVELPLSVSWEFTVTEDACLECDFDLESDAVAVAASVAVTIVAVALAFPE